MGNSTPPLSAANRERPTLAESEARIALTLDKDFWQIAVQRRIPLVQSGVALFRVHPATPENIEPLVRAFVEANRVWPDP